SPQSESSWFFKDITGIAPVHPVYVIEVIIAAISKSESRSRPENGCHHTTDLLQPPSRNIIKNMLLSDVVYQA
ncbi:hypothetical protein SB773_34515, partial [Bacillus sp. SIMBA_074]|uniref:hypothetical protein n=1 Tax=Bacillus sp. SIMBA_074 TaxID=3085812 RepID=UPI00397E3AFF